MSVGVFLFLLVLLGFPNKGRTAFYNLIIIGNRVNQNATQNSDHQIRIKPLGPFLCFSLKSFYPAALEDDWQTFTTQVFDFHPDVKSLEIRTRSRTGSMDLIEVNFCASGRCFLSPKIWILFTNTLNYSIQYCCRLRGISVNTLERQENVWKITLVVTSGNFYSRYLQFTVYN